MRELWAPPVEECKIWGIQHAYSKKMLFHSGKPRYPAHTFSLLFTAPQEELSSLWWWSLLPHSVSSFRGSPRTCTGVLQLPAAAQGSITSGSPVASLLCLPTSLFLRTPKCRHCSFPCSHRGMTTWWQGRKLAQGMEKTN